MEILAHYPSALEKNVVRNPFIWVQFDVALDRSTVNTTTFIVVKKSTREVVEGVVDYIPGTKKITFQLYDFLERNTTYSVIVVGGASGIHQQSPRVPWTSDFYVWEFTTGETIDANIPLANRSGFKDGEPFAGGGGVYQVVFGRTGEPISHVVTTAAEIGPSGEIVPAPFGAERYISASGVPPNHEFLFLGSTPANNEQYVFASGIVFRFNTDISLVESFDVTVQEMLGRYYPNENNEANYQIQWSGSNVNISTLPPLGVFVGSSLYTFTLYNVVDLYNRKIDKVVVQFWTRIWPMYTTAQLIRFNLGPLLKDVSDDMINGLIYENSMWIYQHATPPFDINQPPLAAIDYVICKTKLDLIYQILGGSGLETEKSLADLRISYGPIPSSVLNQRLKDLSNCVEKNLQIVVPGYHMIPPSAAVKSLYDIRRPSWKRLENADFERKSKDNAYLTDIDDES